MVPGGGVEPPWPQGPADFESAASASSAIPALGWELASQSIAWRLRSTLLSIHHPRNRLQVLVRRDIGLAHGGAMMPLCRLRLSAAAAVIPATLWNGNRMVQFQVPVSSNSSVNWRRPERQFRNCEHRIRVGTKAECAEWGAQVKPPRIGLLFPHGLELPCDNGGSRDDRRLLFSRP